MGNVLQSGRCTMSEWQKTRRNFLKAAAGVTVGTTLAQQSLWAQSSPAGATATPQPDNASPKINRQFVITPDQALDWNAFKAEGGPTYAGSASWKRYTDFLIAKM